MRKIICEKLPRITKNRKKLESILEVKITNRGKEVFVDGASEDEYVAEKVIDALNFGFPFSVAVLIKKEGHIFEVINIKDYSRRKNLKEVRARIIGKNGLALKTLASLTDCAFELKDNEVGIVGAPESIKFAQNAITSIVEGAKHGNVYKFLERQNKIPSSDLGLKK